jgi:hypothetical protein
LERRSLVLKGLEARGDLLMLGRSGRGYEICEAIIPPTLRDGNLPTRYEQ